MIAQTTNVTVIPIMMYLKNCIVQKLKLKTNPLLLKLNQIAARFYVAVLVKGKHLIGILTLEDAMLWKLLAFLSLQAISLLFGML